MSREIETSDAASDSILSVRSISTTICAVMLVLYAMYFARSLVVPIVTALFAYLTLRPIVRVMRQFRIPPTVSAAAVMIVLACVLAIGAYLVVEPAQQVIANAPANLETVKDRLSFVLNKVKELNDATESMSEIDTDQVASKSDDPVPVEVKQPAWSTNLSIVTGTGNIVSFLSVAGVFLYFLLATGDDLIRNIMRALPSLTARKQLNGTIENVQEGLGSYLSQVTVINAGLGLAVGVSMWLLGMPSPVLWGVMAMAFNFVPIVGAMFGTLIVLIVALVNFESAYFAFLVAGSYATLTAIEGQFITPSILGRSMEVSPVLVFLSISIWGWMWGLMGVFLSVAMLIAIRMVCEQYEGLTPLATVLGGIIDQNRPKPAPQSGSSAHSESSRSAVAQPSDGSLRLSVVFFADCHDLITLNFYVGILFGEHIVQRAAGSSLERFFVSGFDLILAAFNFS